MDTLEIIKGKHKCRICGKLINFDNKYKDKSMSFKNHLKQKHNIDKDMKEVYVRYGLSLAGYRVRKVTATSRNPELKTYIFNK